jgi:hypothetical protein
MRLWTFLGGIAFKSNVAPLRSMFSQLLESERADWSHQLELLLFRVAFIGILAQQLSIVVGTGPGRVVGALIAVSRAKRHSWQVNHCCNFTLPALVELRATSDFAFAAASFE